MLTPQHKYLNILTSLCSYSCVYIYHCEAQFFQLKYLYSITLHHTKMHIVSCLLFTLAILKRKATSDLFRIIVPIITSASTVTTSSSISDKTRYGLDEKYYLKKNSRWWNRILIHRVWSTCIIIFHYTLHTIEKTCSESTTNLKPKSQLGSSTAGEYIGQVRQHFKEKLASNIFCHWPRLYLSLKIAGTALIFLMFSFSILSRVLTRLTKLHAPMPVTDLILASDRIY